MNITRRSLFAMLFVAPFAKVFGPMLAQATRNASCACRELPHVLGEFRTASGVHRRAYCGADYKTLEERAERSLREITSSLSPQQARSAYERFARDVDIEIGRINAAGRTFRRVVDSAVKRIIRDAETFSS